MNAAWRLAVLVVLTLEFCAAIRRPLGAQETSSQKSSADAVAAYRDAANLQNNGAFDVAVEEWQKFLKAFPRNPLAAKAQHYLGVCQLQLKDYAAAAASFQAVIKNHPRFELLEDAYLNLASCQYALAAGGKIEMYSEAAETFIALLTAYPKGKHLEEALFYLGESLVGQGKKEAALTAHGRLLKEFPNSKRRADALYAVGVAQEELGKHAEAGRTFDVFLKEFGDHALATEVRLRKAEMVLQAGDVAGAEKLFSQITAVRGFSAVDHALSRQAYCLAKLDRSAEAAALYARVATEYPTSSYAADATLSAGRCFYRADQMSAAKEWLQRALNLQGESATEAAHWLCRILIKSGQAAAAAELAGGHLQAGVAGPFAANLRIDQADALYEIPAKRADALTLYTKFSADHPRHELASQALYSAAFAAMELKRFDEGLRRAGAFLQAFPRDKLAADVKYVAAECNVQLKKYDDAKRLYAELVEANPGHAEIDTWRLRKGLVAYLQKDYDMAAADLSPLAKSLKSNEARAEAFFVIGASHFHLNRFAEAAAALSQSLTASENWRQADETLLILARSLAKLGKPAEAKRVIERMLASFPRSGLLDQAHYRLGELAYGADDYAGAIAEYQVVANKYADSQLAPYAIYGLGWAQLKSKDFAAGIKSFTAMLTKHPEHQLRADAHFGRALCRRQAGDPKGAIGDIDEYLKSKPDRAHTSDALHERGLAQVAASDFAGAAGTFMSLLKSDPQYAGADKVLYEAAWAMKSQDKHADAAAYFSRIAKDHPNSPLAAEAWFHVGENLYDAKSYREAVTAYTAAKAAPTSGELGEKAAHKLGWAYFQLKDYERAQVQFDEQLAAFPRGTLAADAVFMKAECLFRQEDYKQAWPVYQAALKTKPSTPTIEALTLLHAGQSAAQLNQWPESIKLYTLIPDRQPESPLLAEALYERGWAQQNLGKTAEALADYEAAANKSRDHVGARARFMQGELLFTQKKHAEAIREFQRAMFGYGGDEATSETKNWQAKSGYEAGRCAEVQILMARDAAAKQKHAVDATRFYAVVVERHASHPLAAEAKKRLVALGATERAATGPSRNEK